MLCAVWEPYIQPIVQSHNPLLYLLSLVLGTETISLTFGKTDWYLIRNNTWILVLGLFNKHVLTIYYVPGTDLGDLDTLDISVLVKLNLRWTQIIM